MLLYFFLSSSIFNINDIRVENNALLSDQQIIELSGIEKGKNIFAAGGVGTIREIEKNPYVSDAKINRKLPGMLIISVTEKEPVVAVKYRNQYILLDSNGDYIDAGDSPMYATVVTGVDIKKWQKGKNPDFKDEVLFNESLKLINGINNAGMYLKKAEISASFNIKGYVSDTLVVSGTSTAILSNIDNLKYILFDLDQKGIQRGIIRIGEDGYSSFSPVTE
ncbi:MAG: FtsQ-type POTRA domain-containing protein [Firmicutes bacterium]|nr:FtsQ-type POTRA domain-containing protein [Bacillota bacterium]